MQGKWKSVEWKRVLVVSRGWLAERRGGLAEEGEKDREK